MLEITPHPRLEAVVLTATLPDCVEAMPSPEWLTALLNPQANAPVKPAQDLKDAVRAMLRHGKFKPAGRNKPSSEYLAQAAAEGRLSSINLPVDIGNAVSLHSGLPISVLDVDLARPPFRIAIAPEGSKYVFNPSGQELDAGDLLCLHDTAGPCGSAVKDSQRTKTHAGTRKILIVIWGVKGWEKHVEATRAWCLDILKKIGATVE
jgi:DNA/RNA-binding domain of Phe-tRNA-synthetase-like protein